MIAALPMYARPETRAAEARLWDAMRAHGWDGIDQAPDSLSAPFDLWSFWASPNLVFGQTCSLPFRLMTDRPTLIGAPMHPLGLTPGTYQSVIITHASDTRSIETLGYAPLAINEARSQSGWAAAWEAGLGHGPIRATGSHRESASAIVRGHSEVAAIDIVTWEMLTRWEPALIGDLRVAGRSSVYPALPFITRIQDAAGIGQALRSAVAGLSREDQQTLLLYGISDVVEADYLSLPNPPAPQI